MASYKKHDHSSDKDKNVHQDEPPMVQSAVQAPSFPSLNYNMPCNMMTTVNSPWPVNSFENMTMNQHNATVCQPTMPMAAGLHMVQPPPSSMNPSTFMGIPGENMYGVVGTGNYCQYGAMPGQDNMLLTPVKEVVHLTKCVLYPPNPNSPRPTTRERPLGCKTVFVGGLPDKITEEIVEEIFQRCGTIETVRMSKKNFCHIRFTEEMYVNKALYFSGYRLKIENKDEAPFTGRLHVDYARARVDQYDYECKQRALQREARHQEQDYYRPPTPPVILYTDHEASLIREKLKDEKTFAEAASILITWLENGECTKKSAGSFYSMIQSTHNHVKKLQLDKVKYEDELNEAKKMLKQQLEGIIRQFIEIEKIYKAASLQKCWDQFTKAQRKRIKMWKKQNEELKNAYVDEMIDEREDEEMDLSDNENDAAGKKDTDIEKINKLYQENIHTLYQEKNDSLKCQLEATQSQIHVMQSDHENELEHKNIENATTKQALQNQYQEDVHKYQEENDSLKYQLEALKNKLKCKENAIVAITEILQISQKENLSLTRKLARNKCKLIELRAVKHQNDRG